MSYTRSFTKTIAVSYSGTASKTIQVGDTSRTVYVNYSGVVHEPVTVNVAVDTDQFDASVSSCNNNVNLLTGSVVATEAAHVASIQSKSKQIGETIVNGFFNTVRSEISQQITELSCSIDSTLLHLKELARRCVDKQHQMEADYNRISKRYASIFNDLNNELKNRIYELDRPTFKFKELADASSSKIFGSDVATTVPVSGAENAHLEAVITASKTKNQTRKAIAEIKTFLMRQKMTDSLLAQCSIGEDKNAVYYAPVCYVEANDSPEQISRHLFASAVINDRCPKNLLEDLKSSAAFNTPQESPRLRMEFNAEVASQYTGATDNHSDRVRDYITKLFNNTYQK